MALKDFVLGATREEGVALFCTRHGGIFNHGVAEWDPSDKDDVPSLDKILEEALDHVCGDV